MNSQNGTASVTGSGDLDTTFGENGIVNVPPGSATVRCMVEDDQGGIIHALRVGDDIWVYRVFSDGRPDPQFGDSGVTKWAFVAGHISVPVQLILQNDGKFLLVGATQANSDFDHWQIAIAQFNGNGSPSLMFGNKILPLPAGSRIATNLPRACLQPDGKILVANSYSLIDEQHRLIFEEILLYRLNAKGETDPTLGGGRGVIAVRFNGQDSKCEGVASTRDGKILVSGTTSRWLGTRVEKKQAVAQFGSSGALDSAFARNGCWEADGRSQHALMMVHGDKIIIVGIDEETLGTKATIGRLKENGEFDPAFNNGKRLIVEIPADEPGYGVWCHAVALQSDEAIVVAGEAGRVDHSFWLRVNKDGTLDLKFADKGIRIFEPSSYVGDLLVQKNNQRIVLALDSANVPRPKLVGISI